ncbi:hypothetical protein LC040_06670 [Bacillus tianshenii]|nr:hypothetical protein LC040_06670 [Bacillus tianshenii]
MAFGITKEELRKWKEAVQNEEISFLTHFWLDERFPGCNTVTKVGCSNLEKLTEWGKQYGLQREWIDMRNDFPHFDLFGERQLRILKEEQQFDQIRRFKLDESQH